MSRRGEAIIFWHESVGDCTRSGAYKPPRSQRVILSKRAAVSSLIGMLCAFSFLCAACSAHRSGPTAQPVRAPAKSNYYAQMVQAAQVSVEPEEYVGACPVHIKTTGGITGTP